MNHDWMVKNYPDTVQLMIVNNLISLLKIWAEWNLSVIILDYLTILIAPSHHSSLNFDLDHFAMTLIISKTFKHAFIVNSRVSMLKWSWKFPADIKSSKPSGGFAPSTSFDELSRDIHMQIWMRDFEKQHIKSPFEVIYGSVKH